MLFHRDIGFPKHVQLPKGLFKLIWSGHAIESAENDRYGKIVKVNGISLDSARIFEVELCNKGNISKFCYRSHHCDRFDIVYVLVPHGSGCLRVKTVWLNAKADNHHTLDKGRYSA